MFGGRSNRMMPACLWRAIFLFALGGMIGACVPVAAAPPRPNESKQLSVERIYGAPSLSGQLPSDIEWAPDSKRVSFLALDSNGVELRAMDVATGRIRTLVTASVLAADMPPEQTPVVQATGLGRVHEPDYLWSPRDNALLLIGSRKLVLLDLKTMAAKSIVTGADILEDPKFSPDGKWVSFVRDFNLWVENIATGKIRELTRGGSQDVLEGQIDWVYAEELDLTSAYWWSPDSAKIAYFQMDERPVTRYPIMDMSSLAGAIEYTRYPEAGGANPIVRVGVASVDGGGTAWMNTGRNTDVYLARVAWLRDSRRVAIERLNRAQNRLDLLFCNAATGASQKILTDKDKYWVNVSGDLYFFSDGRRFLWSSERTGFRHFYLYNLSGKRLGQLTTGKWGILGSSGFVPGAPAHPAVDEAHGYIYFIANKDNVLDRQLYRVSLANKTVTRITRKSGTHNVLIAPDCSAFVDTYSNVMMPPRVDLYRMNGSRVAAIDANKVAALASYHLSPVQFLTLAADDGTKLHAEMIRPPDFDASRKYPVLISVYGGPGVQSVRNVWGGVDFLWEEMMAEHGYIIFALDNRGTWGRGHSFETPIYHQLGKVELEDQLTGVKYLKSLPYVDGSRMGIWGWSYGGTMALDALTKGQGVFKAGAAIAPVTNWRLYDTIYTERYMGRPQDNSSGYDASSPVNYAADLQGKLLIAQGTGDDNVHFANTTEFINELIQAGRYPNDVVVLPGRGHSISDVAARIELFREITGFFLHNL